MTNDVVIHADDCAGWNDPDKDFNGCNCVVNVLARKDAEIAQLKKDYKRVCAGFNTMTREVERGYGTPEEMAELREMLETVKQDRYNEACMHIQCCKIAETGEKWEDGVTPSLAMRKVLELWQDREELRKAIGKLLRYPEYDQPGNWIRSFGLEANSYLEDARRKAGLE